MYVRFQRVWPASQRDVLYLSAMRKMVASNESDPDTWLVCNFSVDHHDAQVSGEAPRRPCHVCTLCLFIYLFLNSYLF